MACQVDFKMAEMDLDFGLGDFSSASSSEDEDQENLNLLEMVHPPRRPRVVKPRMEHFDGLDDVEFFVRFRLSKPTVLGLLVRIEHRLEHTTDRNMAVTPINQLLLTLRFYALGSMIISAADFVGVHVSTACRIIHRVTTAIADLAPEEIKFPDTPDGILALQAKFYDIARFPHCIGAIDCTHIRIQSPGGDRAEYFRNRKGYFSINVQTICDPELRVLDIVASYPGSSHDTNIFNGSAIKARFDMGEFGSAVLVGDGGYPIMPYLITPLENPNCREEELFNESQIRTRNPVERKYGVWKRRFPILCTGMKIKLERTMDVIVAAAVLQNIAVNNKENVPPIDPLVAGVNLEDAEVPVEMMNNNNGVGGNDRVRRRLIEYFRNMQ